MFNQSTRDALAAHVASFNRTNEESVVQAVPNGQAEAWMQAHIPRALLPDPALETAYYFRWWVYRKHIKRIPGGFVVTEFHPDVPWAGKHNTIVASAAHHVDEGRWLRACDVLDSYIPFFYRGGGAPRLYSNWLEAALLRLCEARGDTALGEALLPDLVENYTGWEESNLHRASGLYWSIDDRDASEFSISGNGLRPTLNCYQYANARSIATFARRSGGEALAERFEAKAAALKERINALLWRGEDAFYKAIPLQSKEAPLEDDIDPRRNVREIWGYLPWTFGVAPEGRAEAFRQLLDVNGFRAAHGMTTAERRHPGFGLFYTGDELNDWLQARGEPRISPKGHECLWNGPSWPFSTCLALRAVANVLDSGEPQSVINAADYTYLLTQYALAHRRMLPDGTFIPWLDENMHPDTGDWISRTRLAHWDDGSWSREKGGRERGKDYNHSTFCDLVIGGLFGVQPTLDTLRIAPLFPAHWSYAVLEDLRIHGHRVDIRYENPVLGGQGYTICIDGDCAFQSEWPAMWENAL